MRSTGSRRGRRRRRPRTPRAESCQTERTTGRAVSDFGDFASMTGCGAWPARAPPAQRGCPMGDMRLGPVVRGMLTYVPVISDLLPSKTGVGGHTDSAAYCYGVWMKHRTLLHEQGL